MAAPPVAGLHGIHRILHRVGVAGEIKKCPRTAIELDDSNAMSGVPSQRIQHDRQIRHLVEPRIADPPTCTSTTIDMGVLSMSGSRWIFCLTPLSLTRKSRASRLNTGSHVLLSTSVGTRTRLVRACNVTCCAARDTGNAIANSTRQCGTSQGNDKRRIFHFYTGKTPSIVQQDRDARLFRSKPARVMGGARPRLA